MRHPLSASLTLAVLAGCLAGPVQAQPQAPADHSAMDHHAHMMGPAQEDGRQVVDFPPPMREHLLSSMRGHLQAVSDILAAVSAGDYASAGRIADARLGVQSPAAEGCRVEPAPGARFNPMGMEQMMAQYMPEGMRQAGMAMHQAASDFAAEAKKAQQGGDGGPALRALANVTARCTACHGSYRLER